jgi:hypothetical protein
MADCPTHGDGVQETEAPGRGPGLLRRFSSFATADWGLYNGTPSRAAAGKLPLAPVHLPLAPVHLPVAPVHWPRRTQ